MKKHIRLTTALALFLGIGLTASAQKSATSTTKSKAQRVRVTAVKSASGTQAKQATTSQASLTKSPALRATGKSTRVRRMTATSTK